MIFPEQPNLILLNLIRKLSDPIATDYQLEKIINGVKKSIQKIEQKKKDEFDDVNEYLKNFKIKK